MDGEAQYALVGQRHTLLAETRDYLGFMSVN